MQKKRKLCVLHCNCQGEEYRAVLNKIPEFTEEWDIQLFTNYLKDPISDDILRQADLFIYQHLESKWNNLSSDFLIKKLKPKTKTLCLPNMFFSGYWPFLISDQFMEYGDFFLNKLLEQKIEKPIIIKLYLDNDISNKVDVKAKLEESLSIQEEKEKRSFCKTTALTRQLWQSEQTYFTWSHPKQRLVHYVLKQLLVELNISIPSNDFFNTCKPLFGDFELPIHPQVIQILNLKFLDANNAFNIYNRKLSFVQYLSRYIDCYNNRACDFMSYLHLV